MMTMCVREVVRSDDGGRHNNKYKSKKNHQNNNNNMQYYFGYLKKVVFVIMALSIYLSSSTSTTSTTNGDDKMMMMMMTASTTTKKNAHAATTGGEFGRLHHGGSSGRGGGGVLSKLLRVKQKTKMQQHYHQFFKQQPVEDDVSTTTTTTTTTAALTTTTASPSPFIPTTQIGHVAKAFENVYSDDSTTTSDIIIHTPRLLQACTIFATVMRNTGQTPVAKDLEGNIKYIENSMKQMKKNNNNNKKSAEYGDDHDHDDHDGGDNNNNISLESLLLYESNILKIHQPNGVLKNPSGAIGSLWIRRSLQFQYDFYNGILEIGSNNDNKSTTTTTPTTTPTECALHAYQNNLESYHGWTLRNIYRVGLKTFSPASKLDALKSIGGFDGGSNDDRSFGGKDDDEIMNTTTERELKYLLNLWKPLLQKWKQLHVELDLEDIRKV